MTTMAKGLFKQYENPEVRAMLENDANLRRWYLNYAKGSIIVADTYLRRLAAFCIQCSVSPSAYVQLPKRKMEEMAFDYIQEMETKLNPKSGRKYAPSYIESSLKPIVSWAKWNRKSFEMRIKIADANSRPTLTNERVPTQEELRRVLYADTTPLRTRASIAIMAFSGCRPEVQGNYMGLDGLRLKDFPELEIGEKEVRFTKIPTLMIVRAELSKSRYWYPTFVLEEGCELLKQWLDKRIAEGEKLTLESGMIVSTERHQKVASRMKINDVTPFIRTPRLCSLIRKAMRASSLPWRPYIFRSYFDTQQMLAESKGMISHPYVQLFMGQVLQGTLTCTYAFTKSPEKTSCSYVKATGITSDFNIAWATTVAFVYANQTSVSTSSKSQTTDLGNAFQVVGGETNNTVWERALLLKWADTGQKADVSYGPLGLPEHQAANGVVVVFQKDVDNIDPSLYQSNSANQSRSCAFSSNVTIYDTLLYVGDETATPTDTQSNVYGKVVGQDQNYSTSYYVHAYIYTGIAGATGSDTITSSGGSLTTGSAGMVYCYDLQYTSFQQDVISEGTYYTSTGAGTGPIQTQNVTPANNEFVIAMQDYAVCDVGYSYASGGSSGTSAIAWMDYDVYPAQCSNSGIYDITASEYANAWGGSSTTMPMSTCGAWYVGGSCIAAESMAAFQLQGIVPFTATLDSIGSIQTVTVSGDGRSTPSFSGNGVTFNIKANSGGTVTLTLPSGYVWDNSTSTTLSLGICSGGGTCSSAHATYHPVIQSNFEVHIVNSQSSATSSTFQQQVTIPLTQLVSPSSLSSDLGNMEFCADPTCATPLYAWLQGCDTAGCSSSSSYAYTWVKLTTAVPANSYEDITLAFLGTTTEFNPYFSESPKLSSSYGTLDWGGNVFTQYDNFGASTLNKAAWGHSTDGTTSITTGSSGLTLQVHMNGATAAIVTHSSYSGVFDVYLAAPNFPAAGETLKVVEAPVLNTVANSTLWELGNGYGTECYMHKNALGVKSASIILVKSTSGTGDSSLSTHSLGTSGCPGQVYGTAWPSTGNEYSYTSNPPSQLLSATDSTYSQSASYFGIMAQGTSGSSGDTDSANIYYARIRAYPPNGVMPSVQIGVTTSINATLRGGSTQNQQISLSGCGASPAQFTGDGTAHNILAYPSCSLTLSLPVGYFWETTGTSTRTIQTCSSGNCQSQTPSYVKYVQPVNNPNVLVHLNTSVSTVYVNFFNNPTSVVAGSSCGAPPCILGQSTNGQFSYQFNVVFPTQSNFTIQEVVEFDLETNSCYAHAQSSTGAPSTSTWPFYCSSLLNPGNSFKWEVDSSGNVFTQTKFFLNGAQEYSWTSTDVFGSGITAYMTNVYAQSVWAGPSTANYYGNIYSPSGFMAYSGVTPYCGGSVTCPQGLTETGEYSNSHYTSLTGSGTSWNQTYTAGTFVRSLAGRAGPGGGSVLYPTYMIGAPDASSTELKALSSGSSAYVIGSFGTPNNGTLAIRGSNMASSSFVQVQVSRDNVTYTSVYSGTWSSGSLSWIPVASVTNIQYVKVTASYSGGQGSDIYIDAITLYMGSYVQSQPSCPGSGCGTTNTGQYFNSTRIIGLPDSAFTELKAPSNGDTAWVVGNFGTYYSGVIMLDGYSYNNTAGLYNSLVTVAVSSDLTNWRTVYSFTWSPSPTNTPAWLQYGTLAVFSAAWDAQYVRITVQYNTPTAQPADLLIDAIYIA